MPNTLAEALAALEARVAAIEPATQLSPLPGFGTIDGTCGRVAPRLDDVTPSLLGDLTFDFGIPFDELAHRSQLTPGATRLLDSANTGGSSVRSEIFAFEALARCERASLIKTETEIVYDQVGKSADFSVEIGGRKVGVNVARAFAWPFGTPYTSNAATNLLTARLGDIIQSSRNVSAGDAWVKQLLVVMAVDQQHADTLMAAYRLKLDYATRADTIVYVIVTHGNDANLYVSIR